MKLCILWVLVLVARGDTAPQSDDITYRDGVVYPGQNRPTSSLSFGDVKRCKTPRGFRGACIPLSTCPPLNNRRFSSAYVTYLQTINCGFDYKDPKICCSLDDVEQVLGGVSKLGTTQQSASFSNVGVPLRKILPKYCGKTNETNTRIVGGQEAPVGAWPWIAALGYKESGTGSVTFQCGGVLITNRHVLTSAVCVHGRSDLVLVRLGEHSVSGDVRDGAHPEDFEIERSIIHPEFIKRRLRNDIAILKLKRDVHFREAIQPICLPRTTALLNKDWTGHSAYLAGWGADAYLGDASDVLKEVQLPFVPQEQCKEAYKVLKGITIDNTVICAGYKDGGKDACMGDSGSPLMAPLKNVFYAVGIVSFGLKCGEPGIPGVYTHIAHYMDWILSQPS